MSDSALNTPCYTQTVATTSVLITLREQDMNVSKWEIYNDGSTALFVVGGETSPTAVFPTSATDPVVGKVIGPNMTCVYRKNPKSKYLALIRASGSGSAFASPHTGD